MPVWQSDISILEQFLFSEKSFKLFQNEVSDLSMLSSGCFVLLFQSSKTWTFAVTHNFILFQPLVKLFLQLSV